MKKATLLTFLFAVLMIALLVSCNTSPDPLPDETTTGDVTLEVTPEVTEEITTAEVTTAEGTIESKGDGDDEGKTEALTTVDVACESYLSVNGDVVYYLVGDPPEKAEGVVTIADTETPWYITEWETVKEYVPAEVPEEKQDLALHFPQTTRVETNELIITVNFFQEYYRLGDPVQIQFTIESKTGLRENEWIEFRSGLSNQKYRDRAFLCITDQALPVVSEMPQGYVSVEYFHERGYTYHHVPACYTVYGLRDQYTDLNVHRFNIFPKDPDELLLYGKYYSDSQSSFGNNKLTVEWLLETPFEGFSLDRDYYVRLYLNPSVGCAPTEDDDGFRPEIFPFAFLRIPIEIVEYESVSP